MIKPFVDGQESEMIVSRLRPFLIENNYTWRIIREVVTQTVSLRRSCKANC
jgi:hypothetical protein